MKRIEPSREDHDQRHPGIGLAVAPWAVGLPHCGMADTLGVEK